MNGFPPVHLEDQMAYMLKQAIHSTIDILGERAKPIKTHADFESCFKNTFRRLRFDLLPKMKSGDSRGIDAHKLASIACLTVLMERPLYVPANGEGHCVNEMVAFILSMRIIRNYQLTRYCPDKSKWKILEDQMGTLETPNLIYDTQPVIVNTIYALCHLSRSLRVSQHPMDLVLIISSLFFFLDSHSQNRVRALAEAL